MHKHKSINPVTTNIHNKLSSAWARCTMLGLEKDWHYSYNIGPKQGYHNEI